MKKKLCLMLAMLLVAGMIIPSNVSARTVSRNNYRNMIYAAVSPRPKATAVQNKYDSEKDRRVIEYKWTPAKRQPDSRINFRETRNLKTRQRLTYINFPEAQKPIGQLLSVIARKMIVKWCMENIM